MRPAELLEEIRNAVAGIEGPPVTVVFERIEYKDGRLTISCHFRGEVAAGASDEARLARGMAVLEALQSVPEARLIEYVAPVEDSVSDVVVTARGQVLSVRDGG